MNREYEDAWRLLVDEVRSFTSNIRELPVLEPVNPAELRSEVETRFRFDEPIAAAALVEDVARLLRCWTIHVTHPRYFGLFNPSVREISILADAIAALYNPQLAVWSHAPAAQELEGRVLRHLAGLLGFMPDAVSANFTTGGAEANLSGVLAALAHLAPDWDRSGVRAVEPRPAIYITRESHHSFLKIARMTGLGTDALRPVPTTKEHIMDAAALQKAVDYDRAAGWRPLVVVGTVGTTSGGVVDDLPALARVASRSGAWLHVDAAWGGAAAFSPRLRTILDGIERADSVTWDAHKWLSVPMGAGMFFSRHPEALRKAFAVSTSYMPEGAGSETVDPYATTAQWSRRAIGLKVFMALAEIGEGGYREIIEHQARMGEVLRDLLREKGWFVVNDTMLPVVCFTTDGIRTGQFSAAEISRWICRRGRVWLSDVEFGRDERVLRACITSFRTDEEDLRCLIEELEAARDAFRL